MKNKYITCIRSYDRARKGFTLLEMIIVIAVLIILIAIAALNLAGFRDIRALDIAVREVVIRVRDAQQRSITQEEGEQWGVHFVDVASGDYYEIFRGSNYAGGIVTQTVILDSRIEFESFSPAGSSLDIMFNAISGILSSNNDMLVNLKLKNTDCASNPTRCKLISVAENGVIAY